MCGIFVSTSKSFLRDSHLNKANKFLKSRGPDSSNKLIFKNEVSFLHTRLAIQDQSEAGNQPMYSNNKEFIIVYNGEIYNSNLLKKYLKNKYSIKFKSKSDTEILIEGFCVEGKNFISKIDGIYSFIIYNKIKKKLYVARDPLGIKPLLYSVQKDGILFSSDVKTLFHLLNKPNPSNKAIVDLLKLTFIAEPITLFKEINHLESGKIFEYDLNGKVLNFDKIKTKKGSIFFKGESFRESIKILDDLLQESISLQTISDKKVGLFLSSGLDSTLILSYLEKIKYKISYPITLVWKPIMNSTDFQEPEKEARWLTKSLGLNSHLEISAKSDFISIEKALSYMITEGISDPAALSTYFLSQKANSLGCKVMLCGQGADEIFFGYRRHKAVQIYQLIKKFPKINDYFLTKLLNFFKLPFIYRFLKRLTKLISLFGLNPFDFIMKLYTWADNDLISNILNKNEESSLERELNFKNYNSIDHKIIEDIDLKFDLKSLNLRYADRIGMLSSVEIRVPYLSNKIFNYATSLPRNYKYQLFSTKRIIRKLSRKYLPRYITNRPKTGFTFPLQEIFFYEKNYILKLFEKDNKIFNSYFNQIFIKRYLDNFFKGKDSNIQLIFTLIGLKICFDDLYLHD